MVTELKSIEDGDLLGAKHLIKAILKAVVYFQFIFIINLGKKPNIYTLGMMEQKEYVVGTKSVYLEKKMYMDPLRLG